MPLPKGFKHSEETRKKIGLKILGKKHALGSKHPHSEDHKRKIGEANKGKKHPKLSYQNSIRIMRGEKNPNWRGGVTPINESIRKSKEYEIWRTAVFERDNYTCIWCHTRCGVGVKIILHADHIKPFSLFPELRFAIDNGRTLCERCHKTTDTFGGKIKTWNPS